MSATDSSCHSLTKQLQALKWRNSPTSPLQSEKKKSIQTNDSVTQKSACDWKYFPCSWILKRKRKKMSLVTKRNVVRQDKRISQTCDDKQISCYSIKSEKRRFEIIHWVAFHFVSNVLRRSVTTKFNFSILLIITSFHCIFLWGGR